MQGLALLAIYVVVALAGQVLGYGISSLIDRAAPATGLPVFLAIFLGMLALAWPIAVRLMNWLFPEILEPPPGVLAQATVLRRSSETTAMSATHSPAERREVDRTWMPRELHLRLVAVPALNACSGPERAPYLDDLWRFSCEAPDAPHLCKDGCAA
jgi:hypothetical protein